MIKEVITILFLTLLLVGCIQQRQIAMNVSIVVEESNWSMTKPKAAIDTEGGLTIIAPSPTGELCLEFINQNTTRIFNCETNKTIDYDDISDGQIYLESPSVTVSGGN